MLVLVTMFISVSNNLPKTSYMKMIDVWLLFNLLYPFIIVLIHTRMDSLRENDEEEEVSPHTGNALVGINLTSWDRAGPISTKAYASL